MLEIAGIDLESIGQNDPRPLTKTIDHMDTRDAVFAEYITPQPSMETLETKYGELLDQVTKYDRGLRSVRTDQWKPIQGTGGSERLYNVGNNNETENVLKELPEPVDELREKLRSQFGELSRELAGSAGDMDTDTKQRLEDLGYLQ